MRVFVTILCIFFSTPVWANGIPDAGSASAQIYAKRCSVCHSLPHPGRLDWPHWRSMLHVMKQRMDEHGMNMPNDEWRQVAGYLKQHAR